MGIGTIYRSSGSGNNKPRVDCLSLSWLANRPSLQRFPFKLTCQEKCFNLTLTNRRRFRYETGGPASCGAGAAAAVGVPLGIVPLDGGLYKISYSLSYLLYYL